MASIITADTGAVSGTAGLKQSADSSGILALATGTGTTAVTIDASQNVGIGTSSPSYKLDLYDAAGDASINIKSNGTYSNILFSRNGSGGDVRVRADVSNNNLQFVTNGSERARIDSSGNLLVGQTSAGAANLIGTSIENSGLNNARITVNHSSGGSSNGSFYMQFAYGGTVAGTISQASVSTVAYNTSSDYRLKENIAPMVNALDKVVQLKPVTYKWKVDGSDGQGFIAHELAEFIPDCVTGEKDAVDADGNPVYQGIDTSFLVATLTAAIQEQQALITTLTERISALEAK